MTSKSSHLWGLFYVIEELRHKNHIILLIISHLFLSITAFYKKMEPLRQGSLDLYYHLLYIYHIKQLQKNICLIHKKYYHAHAHACHIRAHRYISTKNHKNHTHVHYQNKRILH